MTVLRSEAAAWQAEGVVSSLWLETFSTMNTIRLALVLCVFLTGCCVSKTLLSGNGNVPTGTVGGTVEITACSPTEKEVANQLAKLSDWYRSHWDACATNSDPAACRVELNHAYRQQQKLLLDVLAAMNGQPKAEQQKLLHQMQLKPPRIPK